MAIWFQIAIALNVVYWAVFCYLLTRRRWNVPALVVGIFHMLFAASVSVAPIRSVIDPGFAGLGLGVFQVERGAATLVAALILGWALAAAWIAVGKGTGRWMRLVLVGDLFLGVSMGAAIVLDGSESWRFQLGEHFMATGAAGLLILLGLFTVPFLASALWAAHRTHGGGTAPPQASRAEDDRGGSGKEGGKPDGLHFSASGA